MSLSLDKIEFVIDSKTELLAQLKSFEQLSSRRLSDKFSAGTNVRELVMCRSADMDRLLIGLWKHLNIAPSISLVAVGGYGRGELHPYSDIDLLILDDNPRDQKQASKLAEFITLLWDIGLVVGHATRTLKQCIQLAKSDITVITNLMESRLLCGEKSLFEQVKLKTAPNKIWNAREFFDAKTEEQKIRYKKFNESSYDLEPNLKSSPGGLRDIQLVGWVAQRCYYPKSLFQLIKQNVITKKEYYTLIKCQLFIWKVRFALHLTAGKPEDRLLFDYQKDTAELMGFIDSENLLAVEKMMKRYYRSVLIIRNITDILLQSLEEELPGSAFFRLSKTIDQDYQIINQRIDAIDPTIFSRKPNNLLKIFFHVGLNPEIKGITAKTLRAIRANRNKINPKFINNEKNKALFISFWHIQHASSRAMFLMKRSGVLSDFLPEFQKINGQMQYDMFHSYTVDEHTLFLLKNLTEFNTQEAETEFPLCHQIMSKQSKPELIYLAGLFHDIGKGQGGDHSEIGAQLVESFCQRHSISRQDKSIISWLVSHHLIMSLTAQKRDTSDPEVIKKFAKLVGTSQRLELLYILTVADIRATSGSLWNSWKDSLLKELALATLSLLEDEQDTRLMNWKESRKIALRDLLSEGYSEAQINQYWQYLASPYFNKNPAETIIWHSQCILKNNEISDKTPVIATRKRLDGGGSEIFVYSKDVEDLFANLTATLAQQGLNVQGASIYTDENGYCYDSFFTLDDSGSPTLRKDKRAKLVKAIKTNLATLDSSKLSIQKRMPRQFKHFDVNTEIVFSNDEISQYTRLDIVARDRPGLLALLASAFKESKVRLHDARITTLGEKVEDTFIISHKDNTAITSKEEREKIKQAIALQLASRH